LYRTLHTARAQNVNVVSAYNYMKDGELRRRPRNSSSRPHWTKTGAKEKTWRYRGDIYRADRPGDRRALKAKFPDAMDKAVESYMKAKELDAKGSYKVENVKAPWGPAGQSLERRQRCLHGQEVRSEAIARYRR
jgi:hypothetical protein